MAIDDLRDIADRLSEHKNRFHTITYSRLIEAFPQVAILFSSTAAQRHFYLTDLLSLVFYNTPVTGELPAHIREIVAQLGRDHRKFSIPAYALPEFGRILNRTLLEICADMPVGQVLGAHKAISDACDIMASAMQAEEHSGIPALYKARVISVERRTRRMSVVRVTTDQPIPYRAGQFLPCNANLVPGEWRFLSPANPTNAQGFIEFHVRIKQDGRCSPMFGLAKPGDTWFIGNPLGKMHIPGNRDVLMLAHTQGLGLLRSLLFDLAEKEMRSNQDPNTTAVFTPPNVTLFIGAEFPAELYDLSTLMHLSANHSWLRVYPCVDSPNNPYWAHDTTYSTLPTGLRLNIGSPIDVALRTAPPVHASQAALFTAPTRRQPNGTPTSWINHDVFIHGAAEFIVPTRARILEVGIPTPQIFTIPLG